MIKLVVFAESAFDAHWAEIVLVRAFDRDDLHIHVKASTGKRQAIHSLVESDKNDGLYEKVIHVALVDADSPSVADAREEISKYFSTQTSAPDLGSNVFFTVPTLESWLFADPETASKYFINPSSEIVRALSRIQFTDEIPFPKRMARALFGGQHRLESASLNIARGMDIHVAIYRSPSFRDFISGVGRLIDDNHYSRIPLAGNVLGKRLLASLIKETNDSSKVIYRTLSGNQVTARELIESIQNGDELGQQYASDLLRVARDMLAREANLPQHDGEKN